MKKLEKAWIFIWAGAMLLFGLLTVNGLRFQYGDTVRTIVRGVDDLNLGSDLTGGLELALQPESGLPAEQQLLDNAREVLMKRLDYLGIQNAEVTVDSEENRLLVRFPNQSGVSQSDYPEIVSVLTSRNALTVRDGIASDEQGRPSGEILLEEKDIVSAQASGDRNTNTISVRLSLTEDGQSKFDAAAARLAEAGRNISVWMDNQLISVIYTRNEPVEPVITGEFTADSAIRLAAEINARSLPLSLTAEDFSVISPAQGSQILTTLCRSAGPGLILLAVLMLALYRLPGAVGLTALVIQLELTLAAFTGLVPLVQPVQLTVSGLLGILLTMGFGVNTSVNTAEHIKAELLGGRNLDYAVNHGFKRTYSTLFDGHTTLVFLLILLLTAVSGFVTDLTWLTPAQTLAGLLQGQQTVAAQSLHSFLYAVLAGIAANYISCNWIAHSMMRSLTKYPALRDPVLYGGVRHD